MILPKPKQCSKCPWKVSTNPNRIPNGYSVEKHEALRGTISDGSYCPGPIRVMECHESVNEEHCIGWVHNQLGVGNNIGLRIRFMKYDLSNMEVYGEQHEHFDQTLPRGE